MLNRNGPRREAELLREQVVAASSLEAARSLLREPLERGPTNRETGVYLIYCCRFARLFDDAVALSYECLGARQPKYEVHSRWASWAWARNIEADRDDYRRTEDSLREGLETRFRTPSAKLQRRDAYYAYSTMPVWARRPTQLVLDQSGIALVGRGQDQRLRWADITDATLTLKPAKARDAVWRSTHYVSRCQALHARTENRDYATTLDLSWYYPRFRHPDLLEGEIQRRATAAV